MDHRQAFEFIALHARNSLPIAQLDNYNQAVNAVLVGFRERDALLAEKEAAKPADPKA